MTTAHRVLALLFVVGALVVVGGALSPGGREGVGALVMVGAYPVWCVYRLARPRRE